MLSLTEMAAVDLDEVMARATRWHHAPTDPAAALDFARALASRRHYGHAAAVLASPGVRDDLDAQWLRAHLLLADGAWSAALETLAAIEEAQPLSSAQHWIAAHIEIGAGDPVAALVRLAAVGDADPRAAALFAEAEAWVTSPDVMAASLQTLEPRSHLVEALASSVGMLVAWAHSDVGKLFSCLAWLDRLSQPRWAMPVLARLIALVATTIDDEDVDILATNQINLLIKAAAYSQASSIALSRIDKSKSSRLDLIYAYARFIAPMAEQISGTNLKRVQQTALVSQRAAANPVAFSHELPAPLGMRRLRLAVLTCWYGSPFFFVPMRYRDPSRLEVIAVVVNHAAEPTDAGAAREAGCYDTVLFVRDLSDAAIAQLIKDHGVDVLLDLTGQGTGERGIVLEWRPAPIQVVWTTKLSTTGSTMVDWFLADAALIPPEHDAHFTERVWRYPRIVTPWQSSHAAVAARAPPRQATGRITFGTPASIFKVTDAAIAAWHKIVSRVPGARFAYTAPANCGDETSYLYDRFAAAGFRCDQVVLLSNRGLEDMQRMLGHIDIALDTFPFGCNRTAAECLEQGVPLLTLWGDRLTGRYTATQLHALGLDELIARDQADYVARAVALAQDSDRLDRWRVELPERVRSSQIIDPERAMRTLETALFGMWDAYCAGARDQEPG